MSSKKSVVAKLIALVLFVAVFAVILVTGSGFQDQFWALVPPFVAIALALITKEVYSSLFAGVVLGALMAGGCSFYGTMDMLTVNAFSSAVSDNAGIFVFLVLLGIIVALVNKSGASRAFGSWAEKHIHTKVGALLATFALGVLIFIDDYFNCLTVGSVMLPVTDSKKISRVKLAYIIDATAAPVCMIAPVSSWAAAVSSYADGTGYSGIELFVRAIPMNFYSLFTLLFLVLISVMGFDYGKMAKFEVEKKAPVSKFTDGRSFWHKFLADLTERVEEPAKKKEKKTRARVIDLLLPIIVLIVACIYGLLYVGGFMTEGANQGNLISSFSDTDAFVGLPWGGFIALVAIIIYLIVRRILTFDSAMECVKDGFVAMVPAITILTLATSLKNMTNELGAKVFVKTIMENASGLMWLLPAIIFVVACIIAFATGTSWGTFGILIPIVTNVFDVTDPLFIVGISACLAGAVCGDHCSPISDTTIMASAGAQCNHLDHVETQLPYAITVAAISFVTYLITGVFSLIGIPTIIALPVGGVLTWLTLVVLKRMQKAKA